MNSDALSVPGNYGYFWSSTMYSSSSAYSLGFYSTYVNPANYYSYSSRYYGRTVRWLCSGEKSQGSGSYLLVQI